MGRNCDKKTIPSGDLIPRRALLVGLNYADDPKRRLAGCVTDVSITASQLLSGGQWSAGTVRTMVDATDPGDPDHPSLDNLVSALHWLGEGQGPDPLAAYKAQVS